MSLPVAVYMRNCSTDTCKLLLILSKRKSVLITGTYKLLLDKVHVSWYYLQVRVSWYYLYVHVSWYYLYVHESWYYLQENVSW